MKPRAARFYSPLLLQTGLTILLAGIALMILMWTHLLGPFHFMDRGPRPVRRPLGLLISDAIEATPDSSQQLALWRRFIPDGRDLIAIAALDADLDERVDAMIVPSARVLDRRARSALLRFVDGGGGLLLIGSIGVRDEEGRWLGYDTMRSLLAVREVTPIDPGERPHLRAQRRGALTAALAPAESIRLARESGVPAIRADDAAIVWARNPAASTPKLTGASMQRLSGRGRLLWLAAGPRSSWQPMRGNWQPMVRLLRASVAWVAREPQIERLAWSDGSHLATAHEAHRSDRSKSGKARVETSFERRDPHTLLLHISNHTSLPLRRTALRVYLNRPLRQAKIKSTLLFESRPALRFQSGREFLDVLLPRIEAGRSRSYSLDYSLGYSRDSRAGSEPGTRSPAQGRAAGRG